MSRSLLVLLLILLLVGGGLWYLSRMNIERPLVRVEKTVPNDRLGK